MKITKTRYLDLRCPPSRGGEAGGAQGGEAGGAQGGEAGGA